MVRESVGSLPEYFRQEEERPLTSEQRFLWDKYNSLPFVEFHFELICLLNSTSAQTAVKIYARFNEKEIYYAYPVNRSCNDVIKDTYNLIDPELNRLEQRDMEFIFHSTTDLLDYLKKSSTELPIVIRYKLSFTGDNLALNTAFIRELKEAGNPPMEEYTAMFNDWKVALRKYSSD